MVIIGAGKSAHDVGLVTSKVRGDMAAHETLDIALRLQGVCHPTPMCCCSFLLCRLPHPPPWSPAAATGWRLRRCWVSCAAIATSINCLLLPVPPPARAAAPHRMRGPYGLPLLRLAAANLFKGNGLSLLYRCIAVCICHVALPPVRDPGTLQCRLAHRRAEHAVPHLTICGPLPTCCAGFLPLEFATYTRWSWALQVGGS